MRVSDARDFPQSRIVTAGRELNTHVNCLLGSVRMALRGIRRLASMLGSRYWERCDELMEKTVDGLEIEKKCIGLGL